LPEWRLAGIMKGRRIAFTVAVPRLPSECDPGGLSLVR
jgi:hypothetical protein